jgi:hypothetical protein
MRLCAQRVPEEDQHVELAQGDERADLLVAAERAAQEAGDRQLERLAQQPAGGTSGVQGVAGEQVSVVLGPLEQIVLLAVVGDQGDALRFG